MLTLLLLLTTLQTPQGASALRIEVGTDSAGGASSRWLAMIRRRAAPGAWDSLAGIVRALNDGERAWADLIIGRRPHWTAEIPDLARPFAPVRPPAEAVVVLGNRGGEDAFVHDELTIGFDLGALRRVYGEAQGSDNAARMDRLFRHEYIHLLQKRWLAARPYRTGTPLRDAIAEIWAEGMGTWYSMSDRWRAVDGRPSPAAAGALDSLAPRFAERLLALACATGEEARRLTADLSYGAFEGKWGALPAALWIELEARRRGSAVALRGLVTDGPEGVWTLAERHLSEPDRRRVRRARRIGRSEEECEVSARRR